MPQKEYNIDDMNIIFDFDYKPRIVILTDYYDNIKVTVNYKNVCYESNPHFMNDYQLLDYFIENSQSYRLYNENKSSNRWFHFYCDLKNIQLIENQLIITFEHQKSYTENDQTNFTFIKKLIKKY